MIETTYCGTRLGWDRDERVLVARDDEVRELAVSPECTTHTWGYAGTGPNETARAILCDFYGVPSEQWREHWTDEIYQDFADAKLYDADHFWIITGREIEAFVAKIRPHVAT